MKFKLMIILITLLFATNAKAQDEELDELDFEEQNYEQFDETAKSYVVFGGGFVVNMLGLNFNEINNLISANKFIPNDETFKFDGFLYQLGAQGIVTIGLLPNVRIGIIGMGGSKSAEETIKIDTNGIERNMTYYAGYTGLTIDYAFVPFKSFAIVPGITLGYGSLNFESTQTQKDFSWSDIKPEPSANNYKYELSTSYWHFSPMLNFEYAPTILSLFRVSVGYSMSFGRDWYLNGNENAKVVDVPDKINADGLTIQFGLLLGLFNY